LGRVGAGHTHLLVRRTRRGSDTTLSATRGTRAAFGPLRRQLASGLQGRRAGRAPFLRTQLPAPGRRGASRWTPGHTTAALARRVARLVGGTPMRPRRAVLAAGGPIHPAFMADGRTRPSPPTWLAVASSALRLLLAFWSGLGRRPRCRRSRLSARCCHDPLVAWAAVSRAGPRPRDTVLPPGPQLCHAFLAAGPSQAGGGRLCLVSRPLGWSPGVRSRARAVCDGSARSIGVARAGARHGIAVHKQHVRATVLRPRPAALHQPPSLLAPAAPAGRGGSIAASRHGWNFRSRGSAAAAPPPRSRSHVAWVCGCGMLPPSGRKSDRSIAPFATLRPDRPAPSFVPTAAPCCDQALERAIRPCPFAARAWPARHALVYGADWSAIIAPVDHIGRKATRKENRAGPSQGIKSGRQPHRSAKANFLARPVWRSDSVAATRLRRASSCGVTATAGEVARQCEAVQFPASQANPLMPRTGCQACFPPAQVSRQETEYCPAGNSALPAASHWPGQEVRAGTWDRAELGGRAVRQPW